MAQTNTYIFQFRGLDEGIAKLTTLNKLIGSIGAQNKNINFGGGSTSNKSSPGSILSTTALNAQLAALTLHLTKANKVFSSLQPVLPAAQSGVSKPPYLLKKLEKADVFSSLQWGGDPEKYKKMLADKQKKVAARLEEAMVEMQGKKMRGKKMQGKKMQGNKMQSEIAYVHQKGFQGIMDISVPLSSKTKNMPKLGALSKLAEGMDISVPLSSKTKIMPKMGGQMSMNPFFDPKFYAPLGEDLKKWGNIGGEGIKGVSGYLEKLTSKGSGFAERLTAKGMSLGNKGMEMAKEGGHLLGGRELTRLVMVFGRLGLVVGAVVGSFLALRAGIEVASKAYQEAAKQGIAVATSETINQAFKAIGMSTPNLESILPTLGKGNDTAAILNAAQGGQLGADSQQLLNMAEEFKYAMQEAAKSARQIQQTSKAGQNLSQDGSGVAREWHTLMALFMSDTYEVVHLTLSGVKKLLGWINDLYSSVILFKQMLGLTPKDGGKFTQQVTGGGTKTDTNSFEKIGFVMHGASPEKNLSDINKNTSAAVGLLTKIALAAGVISVANGANAGSVLANTIQTVNTP